MPKNFKFKNDAAKENFLADADKILDGNIFAKQLKTSDTKKSGLDIYSFAEQYLSGFGDTAELITMVKEFDSFATNVKKSRDPEEENPEACKKEAIRCYQILTDHNPSFKEKVRSFAKNSKGVSLGDDGMRLLNSMVQTLDNLSERVAFDVRENEYKELTEQDKQITDDWGEVDREIESFAKGCADLGVDGTDLPKDLAEEEKKLEELNKKLAELKSEEKKKARSEEFETCSKDVLALKDEGFELLNKVHKIQNQSAELADLYSMLGALAKDYQIKGQQYDELTANENDVEKNLQSINARIAAEEKKAENFKEGNAYLNSPKGRIETNRINVMNQYIRDNEIMENALSRLDTMTNGNKEYNIPPMDISESYRKLRDGEVDMEDLDPMVASGIEFYLDTKRALTDLDPDFADDFMKFESNPENKIPADYEKVIGNKIRNLVKDKKEVIDLTKAMDFIQYKKAVGKVILGGVNGDLLKNLREEKQLAETELEDIRHQKELMTEDTERWKILPTKILKDAFPKGDHVTISDVRQVIVQERGKLAKEWNITYGKMQDVNIAINGKKKRLEELKEGLDPIYATKLEYQAEAQKNRVEQIKKLNEDGKTLQTKIQDKSRDFAEYRNSEPKGPSPIEKIGGRLSYIKDHFNDVQSIWSKGMSTQCKTMYDQLKNTVDLLKDPNTSHRDLSDALNKLAVNAEEYLGAKNAQNRPKIFASEQRFWRLSFAEEIKTLASSSSEKINNMDAAPECVEHKKFLQGDLAERISKPDEYFKSQVTKNVKIFAEKKLQEQAKKAAENKKTQQKTNVKKNVNTKKSGSNQLAGPH